VIECPKCGGTSTRVRETKGSREDDCVLRYRTCLSCFFEFPTHERPVSYIGRGRGAKLVTEGDE